MKLSQCKLGEIVEHYTVETGVRVGHIVGLTLVGGMAIPLVRFAVQEYGGTNYDGSVSMPPDNRAIPIGHKNLELVRD